MNVDVHQESLTRESCEVSAPVYNQTVSSNVSVTFVALTMCRVYVVKVCEIAWFKIEIALMRLA